MRTIFPFASSTPLAFVLLLTTVSAVPACTVPVFRYALERWKPAPYPLHVFHRGPLSPAQAKYLDQLAANTALDVSRVDLDARLTREQQALWQKHGDAAALPYVVVQYPGDDVDATPLWRGRLDESALAVLLDSPKRREIVQLLTKGESAVWVLLESGDRGADDDAEQLARRELLRLQKELKLPELAEADQLLSSVPLRLSFTIVRVSRSEKSETEFVRLLQGSDEELEKVRGPILFPVFGRGRLLYGLHGAQLKPATIERWASFLCGACSCQVKELNPGIDLLMPAAWDELLNAIDTPAPPTLSAPPIPPGAPPKKAERPARSPWVWPAVGLTAMVVVLIGGVWQRARRVTPATAPAAPPTTRG